MSDKYLTALFDIRWQLNCHPLWDNLTLIFELKQYEVNIFQREMLKIST